MWCCAVLLLLFVFSRSEGLSKYLYVVNLCDSKGAFFFLSILCKSLFRLKNCCIFYVLCCHLVFPLIFPCEWGKWPVLEVSFCTVECFIGFSLFSCSGGGKFMYLLRKMAIVKFVFSIVEHFISFSSFHTAEGENLYIK